MWIRAVGVLFVILSCTGLGAEAAFRLKRRLGLLMTLKQMVSHLKGEILYANAPLPEAFERTGRRNPGSAGELFQEVAERLRQESGEEFVQIWKEAAGTFAKTSVLSREEGEQLVRFGGHLGYLDRDMQEKTILFYLEDLDFAIKNLQRQEPEKCRLFMSMGLLSGLFLAVVMI